MAAATFTSTFGKTTTSYNATLITQVYTFTGAGDVSIAAGNLPASVGAFGLPFGSAQIAITSGSVPTSITLLVGNDGVPANMVALGQTLTFGTQTIQIIDLTSGVSSATTEVGQLTLANMPYVFYNWSIIGANNPNVITITSLLMGTRG